jgi:hypothetical protein
VLVLVLGIGGDKKLDANYIKDSTSKSEERDTRRVRLEVFGFARAGSTRTLDRQQVSVSRRVYSDGSGQWGWDYKSRNEDTAWTAQDLPYTSEASGSGSDREACCSAGQEELEELDNGSNPASRIDREISVRPDEGDSSTERPLYSEPILRGVIATRYGESYNGGTLGCPRITQPAGWDGKYHSELEGILAVGYNESNLLTCGERVFVCRVRVELPAFIPIEEFDTYRAVYSLPCIQVWRVDTCPGCGQGHIDLSERGIGLLCGEGLAYRPCDYLSGLYVYDAVEDE